MASIAETEYKGHQLLIIRTRPDEQFPLKFGVKKARLILEHLEDIRAFVRKHAGGMTA